MSLTVCIYTHFRSATVIPLINCFVGCRLGLVHGEGRRRSRVHWAARLQRLAAPLVDRHAVQSYIAYYYVGVHGHAVSWDATPTGSGQCGQMQQQQPRSSQPVNRWYIKLRRHFRCSLFHGVHGHAQSVPLDRERHTVVVIFTPVSYSFSRLDLHAAVSVSVQHVN